MRKLGPRVIELSAHDHTATKRQTGAYIQVCLPSKSKLLANIVHGLPFHHKVKVKEQQITYMCIYTYILSCICIFIFEDGEGQIQVSLTF